MKYREIKKFCDEKIKKYPEFSERYKREIRRLVSFEKNGRNIYQEFKENIDKINNAYVIPFLLGFTKEVDLTKPMEIVQVVSGASGGIDVDTDMSPAGRDVLFKYLERKYGEDRVFSVGTYSKLGIKSAIKDILRVYKVDFKESNKFTGKLDGSLTLEENIVMIQETYPDLYKFYLKHKEIIDMSKDLDGKIRQISKHAGGVVILDRPIYELIPVERVSGSVLTAFPESGSDNTLDLLGIIKFDVLGISVLDIIKNTVEQINEDIYLIEDDDGIVKVVPESYLKS